MNLGNLQRYDFQTDTWGRLSQALSLELQGLRESNDLIGNDPITTAATRGRIAAIKDILALPERSAGIGGAPDLARLVSTHDVDDF